MTLRLLGAVLVCLAAVPVADSDDRAGIGSRRVDPRDALLAALGTATLECLGTVGPSLYATGTGVLARTFDSCPNGDRSALGQIDALLGVQESEPGRADGLAEHYVARWEAFVAAFPGTRADSCPAWERIQAIEAPTFESVPRNLGRVATATFRYRIASESCGRSTSCAVARAAACARGFGPEFLVELDPRGGSVVIDPAWWLTRYEYPTDSSNPFKMPGYYHPMSYYGDLPGVFYGALQREGEACSQYDASSGKHYTDRKLQGIDCGGGWICMTYCMEPPLPPQ